MCVCKRGKDLHLCFNPCGLVSRHCPVFPAFHPMFHIRHSLEPRSFHRTWALDIASGVTSQFTKRVVVMIDM